MSRIIPREHHAPFRKLAALDGEQFATLVSAISSTSPKHLSFEEHVVSLLLERKAIAAEEEEGYLDLVSMLITVYFSWVQERHKTTVDEFIDEIIKADVRNPDGESFKFDTNLAGERFSELMNIESLAIAGKTSVLARFGARVFRDVYAVTDIRPIFGKDHDATPTFAVLAHSFRFRVWDAERQDFSDIFMIVDDTDLEQLKNAIDAAQRKSEMLRSKSDHQLVFLEKDR